jgi:hypothetical protein
MGRARIIADLVGFSTDSGVLNFGADKEITLTHDPDDGLILKHAATADDSFPELTFQTGDTDIAVNDLLGRINFQAPDEGAGTDAILVAGAIAAISEGDFSSSANATSLIFQTGASETATTKMTLSSGGNLDVTGVISGAGFTAGSAVLAEAELELLDGLTAGTAIASKVVTTDANIDSTGMRNLTISGEIDAATGDFSGVVDVAGATTTAAITASGIIKTDDTTAATSTTDGSLQTDGGLSVAADAVIGDDLLLLSDAAVLNFGADSEIKLTHVADTGLLLNAASVIQFRDSAINIGSPADGDLDINADDEIELNSTLIDINGNVEISGTAAIVGIATFTDDIIIGDGKTIGSASDVDAITIGSDGDVTLTQDLELQHDGAILSFGANDEIALTHVHDTGLLLTDSGGTPTLQLHDAAESVSSDGSKLILTSNSVAFSLPTADGSANQVLATNGSAVLSFADNSGGQLIQTVNTTRVDVVSGTTVMPFDDSIPQKTEGVEFLTVAITPTKNDNKLLISVHLQCQMTNNGQWSMALFQDDAANALAASSERDGASDLEIHSLKHFMTTGTTSETTFKIRSASSGSGTITMNSVAGSRKYGGVLSSSITVQEIEV